LANLHREVQNSRLREAEKGGETQRVGVCRALRKAGGDGKRWISTMKGVKYEKQKKNN